jgi:hypothetical protein
MNPRGNSKRFSARPFTRSPRIQVKRAAVSRGMANASDPGKAPGLYGVTVGPYVYTPGILSKNGVPVVLQVTDPLLQNFLTDVRQAESDLAGRWACALSFS